MAGRGVRFWVWIIERICGSWPSLAPTKNNLKFELIEIKSLEIFVELMFKKSICFINS